jgi:hypothetical protein
MISYYNNVVSVYYSLEEATKGVKELFKMSQPVTIAKVQAYYDTYYTTIDYELEDRLVDLTHANTLPIKEVLPNNTYIDSLNCVYVIHIKKLLPKLMYAIG